MLSRPTIGPSGFHPTGGGSPMVGLRLNRVRPTKTANFARKIDRTRYHLTISPILARVRARKFIRLILHPAAVVVASPDSVLACNPPMAQRLGQCSLSRYSRLISTFPPVEQESSPQCRRAAL